MTNRRFCPLDRDPEPMTMPTDYVTPAQRARDTNEPPPSITLWDVLALALVIVILACAFAGES